MTICFWIDWVRVYKYAKIKGLDSREIIITEWKKKWWTWHVISVIAENETMKVYNTWPVSHAICTIDQSFAH